MSGIARYSLKPVGVGFCGNGIVDGGFYRHGRRRDGRILFEADNLEEPPLTDVDQVLMENKNHLVLMLI